MDDPNINDATEEQVDADVNAANALERQSVDNAKPKRKPRADSGKPRSRSKSAPTRATGITPGALFYTVTSGDGVPPTTYSLKSTQLKPALREIAGYAEVADDHAGALCRVFRAVDEFTLAVDTVRKVRIGRKK